MKPFVFNPAKRDIWHLTMPKGEEITLKQPTMARVVHMKNLMTQIEKEDDLQLMLDFLAEVFSDNLEGITYTAAQISNDFCYTELVEFVQMYHEFVGSMFNEKN